jgi:hypothetical protein
MIPLVAWLVGVMEGVQVGGSPAFAEVKQSFTGVILNWPQAAVMPRTSGFDPEIVGASHSENLLTVKFGVQDADPDVVTATAMTYMAAIDAAIEGAALPPNAARVFVQAHDYGALYQRDSSFAKFPELHLLVEVYE